MSDLQAFRDHCRRMATATHKPECRIWVTIPPRRAWGWPGGEWVIPAPDCGGCVSDADRALFASLAAEVDDYLDRPVVLDLFGEGAEEPDLTPEDA